MPAPNYNAAAVADAVIAHKKGVTLQQGRALRDNLLSVAGFGSGAPINEAAWHPYDLENVGDGANGVFYDFADDGQSLLFASPVLEPDYDYIFVVDDIDVDGVTNNFQVEGYRDTDAAYDSPVTITRNGYFLLRNPAGYARQNLQASEYLAGGTLGSLTIVTDGTIQTYSQLRFRVSGGSGTTSGSVRMLRTKSIWGF